MRIALDISPAVYRRAGIGRYAHDLMAALYQIDDRNEYRAFYNAVRGDEKPDPPLDRLPTHTIRMGDKTWRMLVLLAYLSGKSLDGTLPAADLFHATDHLLPPLSRARSVITVCDLTCWLFPQYHLPLNRWYSRLMLPRFVRRADAVIAISESTRRDLIRWQPDSADKVQVVYPAVSRAFRPLNDPSRLVSVRAKYGLPERFMLYLGTLEPRKNLVTLLDAHRTLLERDGAVPDLVLAGKKGWRYEPTFRRIREFGLEARVRLTGWVDDVDVPALLNAADVFVYPSLYEGFGFPPLEAMACGTPVVCSNASSLPEVIGSAGILVEPRDTGALAEAITRALADDHLRAELRAHGLAQSARFSWERAARETLAVYQALGSGPPGKRERRT